ncbi:MAG: 5-bromo-4-chloroindolyl phosphate hydrolysis family protein [Pseudomonadota bacterium]
MAQRFGGRHSPDGSRPEAPAIPGDTAPANTFRGRQAYQSNIRAKLMFLVPLPLLLTGIGELRQGDAMGMVAELGGLGILLLAAWLLAEGLKAEAAYNARTVARPPAFPRKIAASCLTATGVFLVALGGMKGGLALALVTAVIAGGAHAFSFGIDPLRKKGLEGVSDFDTERVATAIEKAERLLSETLRAARGIGDRALEARVDTMAATARDMFRAVEQDPRDLSGARKFLGVYLRGARDATVKFSDLYSKTRDPQARADYESLLSDLENSFNAQRAAMLADNRTDLDVEIEVLRERLRRDGVSTT